MSIKTMRRPILAWALVSLFFLLATTPKTVTLAETPTYVPRFASHAETVRPAAVFAAFARGEMRRFTFESSDMQNEVERLMSSMDLGSCSPTSSTTTASTRCATASGGRRRRGR